MDVDANRYSAEVVVRVVDAEDDHASAEGDLARCRSPEATHIGVRAHSDDAVSADCDRLGPWMCRVGGEDLAASEDRIRGRGRGRP